MATPGLRSRRTAAPLGVLATAAVAVLASWSSARPAFVQPRQAALAASGGASRQPMRASAGAEPSLAVPKRPVGGGYGVFLAENRAKLAKEIPEGASKVTAVTKLASEKWKALPDAKKAPFEKKYKAAVEKYAKDMHAFTEAGGVVPQKAEKSTGKAEAKKKSKDPNAPKKPAGGAFGCFLKKMRPDFVKQLAGEPVTAVMKLAGEKWRALSDQDKTPYEKAYAKEKAAYEEAKKAYAPAS